MQDYVSRRLAIGDKQIVVLDGLFPAEDVRGLHQFLLRLPYHLSEIDTNETPHNRNWAANLPVPMALGMPILKRCVELGREFHGDQPLELRRAYVNLNRYGDMQYSHQDALEGVTALLYANSEWKDSWGGETVFHDDSGEPVYIVVPKPGRLVLFHPYILHRGGVPSRECWDARVSVAFKLEPSSGS